MGVEPTSYDRQSNILADERMDQNKNFVGPVGFEPTQPKHLFYRQARLSNCGACPKLLVCVSAGTRTQDSYIKSVILFQLSYGHNFYQYVKERLIFGTR